MKKSLALLIIFSLLITIGMTSPVFADNKPITVYIDDVKINFTNNPISENGRTLVEFRPIFEHLGFSINWDNKTKTITAEKKGLKIVLQQNSKIAYVNGVMKKLDVAPKILNGRTMIPLRFVGETSGGTVEWDDETRTVYIFFDINQYLEDAVLRDDVDKIKELISKGANPNYIDDTGRTLLEWAIPTGKVKTVKALIDAGADVNHVNKLGISMLMLATMFGRPEIVQLLLDNNADVNWKDSYGKTVLDYAEDELNYIKSDEYILKTKAIISILRNKIAELEPKKTESDGGNNSNAYVKDDNRTNGDEGYVDSNVKNADDLARYLNYKYGSLDTPLGKWTFKFKVYENDFETLPYDFWIQTDWENENGIGPYDLEYSIKISNEDKEKTLELLKDLQKNVASDAIRFFSQKKICGGYYSGFYEYPAIKVGYESIRFMSWSNYSNGFSYKDTQVIGFHWDDEYDDYKFIEEMKSN